MAQIPGLPSNTGTTCVITPIKAFADNYIWMVSNGRQALVVDPGDATPVLAALAQAGLVLTSILLTHHHQDHVGGVAELLQTTPASVYGPATEALPHCDHSLSEGDQVIIPEFGIELSVLDISLKVGFFDCNNYIRSFKKTVGTTPLGFKKTFIV